MDHHMSLIFFLLLAGVLEKSSAAKCDRRLDTFVEPTELDGRFFITVWSINKTEIVDMYMPNTRYIVTIEGDKSQEIGPQKFTRFLLTADNKNDSSTAEGTFDLVDEMLTQFSDKCPNSIMETSMIPKEDVTIAWTSPPEGSECILIRATVMETPETIYIDEGNLVKTICQDPKALYDDPGPVLPECCACDEAKYEVTFEGLWSRNTHPKDFPSKGWLIRFSDVIGASHTVDYRFWRYNETASEGLQQVAEFGSTRKLESELKDQSENIRTIIKARGISHPNVTGRTFAVFRVDRRHHLMSLVSMIVPSPDWIVGVSGLELCLSNCSWIEHKELNLYPIDAGTDDGITYMSPDAPSDSPEPIRRITSSWPNDIRSPFYDPLGMDMKPMAKLHLSRQRLYEKACNESSSPPVNSGGDNNHKNKKEHKRKRRRNKACRTTPWGSWGPCSTSCGRGTRLRQRNYKDKTAAATNNCNATLTDRGDCYSNNPECNDRDQKGIILDTPACELNEWTTWSSCTTTCGDGSKTRSRNFIHKKNRKYCKSVANGPELQQTIDCENNPCESEEMERVSEIIDKPEEDYDENEDDDGDDEGDEYETNVMNDDDVEVTDEWLQSCPSENYEQWSFWSPCSSTCGPGIKTRSRRPLSDSSDSLWECRVQSVNCTAKILSCGITPEEADEICKEPKITGSCRMSLKRVYFNSSTNQCKFFNYGGCDGNRNNFQTVEECTKVCIDIRRGKKLKPLDTPKDYKVYLSSVLSYHIPVQNERSRKAKRDKFDSEESEDFNGIPASSQVITTTQEYHGSGKVDCQVSEWSEWTHCNECRGYTTITRSILLPARNGGKRCPTKLMRRKKCHNLPNCSKGSRERRKRYRDRKSVWEDNGVDCKLTHWSSWSACHATCGNAIQHRTRRIQIHPYGPHGKPCTRLVEFRKCSMIPC